MYDALGTWSIEAHTPQGMDMEAYSIRVDETIALKVFKNKTNQSATKEDPVR
jgi:hypothetical protein